MLRWSMVCVHYVQAPGREFYARVYEHESYACVHTCVWVHVCVWQRSGVLETYHCLGSDSSSSTRSHVALGEFSEPQFPPCK